MQIKKTSAALLCITALLLGSCSNVGVGGTDAKIDDVTPPNETSGSLPIDINDLTAENLLDSVKAVDYGGYAFTIVTSLSGRFTADESSENEVEKVVFERNAAIEKRYNIKIKEDYVRETEMINSARSALEGGKQYSDLVSATMPTLAKMAAAGCLTNLYSLAYYDTKSGFCNEAVRESITAGHVLYATYDEFTLAWKNAGCVYVNRDMIDADTLYALARQDGWDWDAFYRYAAEGGFASALSADDTILTLFATSGVEPLNAGYGIPLSHSQEPELLDTVAEKLCAVVTMDAYSSAHDDEAENKFINGDCLFLISTVSSVEKLDGENVNFGILPLPSYDGKTRSVLEATACGVAVPACQQDSDRTGLLLTAITAASYNRLTEQQLKRHLYYHLRDNGSALMLEKIYDSVYVNVGMLYSGGYSAIEASSQQAILTAVKNGKSFADIFTTEKSRLETAASKYFR